MPDQSVCLLEPADERMRCFECGLAAGAGACPWCAIGAGVAIGAVIIIGFAAYGVYKLYHTITDAGSPSPDAGNERIEIMRNEINAQAEIMKELAQ